MTWTYAETDHNILTPKEGFQMGFHSRIWGISDKNQRSMASVLTPVFPVNQISDDKEGNYKHGGECENPRWYAEIEH